MLSKSNIMIFDVIYFRTQKVVIFVFGYFIDKYS